ncbi:MAG: TrkH family potassium uptake protein [Lentimicrobiaceae bacterium]|nr:TrkH family potassium uptake protein [Lentimicrobiaceae bacterium]
MRTSTISWKVILRLLGILLVIEGLFMLTPLPFALYYQERWIYLVVSALTALVSGGLLMISTRGYDPRNIGKREGYIVVSFAWMVISLFGSFPFYISGYIPSFTDAIFETASGFSTTGATILTDIEALPKALLFWRSMTHWIGGMGIIVLSLAILPFLGIGGMQLFIAEVPGPTKDKLHPRIAETAKRLWGIYFILTLIQTSLLMFGGMDLFDGLCHAFGTMATGGFSTRNDSIASFSPYIQYVIIVFMILAGTNFTLHYMAVSGAFASVTRNDEFRYYMAIIGIITLVVSVSLFLDGMFGPEASFRHALFQTVSIVTTTGFITSDYLIWPDFAWFLIFLAMFTGGSAGSTGGGIKMIRHFLLVKNSFLEMKRLIHPQGVIPVRINGRPVSQGIIFNVLAFFLIYLLIFASGSMVMALLGLDFDTAIGATAACLGNIGPGIGKVGPVGNFAFIPDFGKWFLSFLMILGRLELFTVLILFSRAFWRN